MNIQLNNVGKKFRNDWVFRNLNQTIESGQKYAILGANGTGKSTLLKIISGLSFPSEGQVEYTLKDDIIKGEDVYKHLVYAAPYAELFEQFTTNEILNIHRKFKSFYNNMSNAEFAERIFLTKQLHQAVEVFSSGMKQRLKLAMAMYSKSDLLLLDEPLSNLDEKGRIWYRDAMDEFQYGRTIVICSNHQKEEYTFCEHTINIT